MRGDGVGQLEKEDLSSDWVAPPKDWGWSTAHKVKRLSCLNAQGGSLHENYLEFFNQTLEEALAAAGFE